MFLILTAVEFNRSLYKTTRADNGTKRGFAREHLLLPDLTRSLAEFHFLIYFGWCEMKRQRSVISLYQGAGAKNNTENFLGSLRTFNELLKCNVNISVAPEIYRADLPISKFDITLSARYIRRPGHNSRDVHCEGKTVIADPRNHFFKTCEQSVKSFASRITFKIALTYENRQQDSGLLDYAVCLEGRLV